MQVNAKRERGCLDTIQTFFFLGLFLAIGIITGISSFDFFRDGSIMYGLGLGVLCLFSIGFVWLSFNELFGKNEGKGKG